MKKKGKYILITNQNKLLKNKTMPYYENNDDEKASRIMDLCTYIFIVAVISILIVGYCVIDFKEKENIKTEKNERD